MIRDGSPWRRGCSATGSCYAESDGNLFNCDVYWHLDVYGAATGVEHIKLSFYLDELQHDTGALRVIPGSHFDEHELRHGALQALAHEPDRVPRQRRRRGRRDPVRGPSRSIRATSSSATSARCTASFNGAARRRLFTVNFAAAPKETAGA